ncbi:MAG TPA: SRPBCC family protein [Methanothrix sp.]|nr:SRPBCC family protein [Methanothrix sp.]
MATNDLTDIIAEPGKQNVLITRVFDAPRDLVFRAFTDPDLIPEYWGPRDLTTAVREMEVGSGGLWRFIQRDLDGNEYAFHGVYHQVLPPERLVYTLEFEGMPGNVLLETVRFEEMEGRTKMTISSVFQTVEDRDDAVQSGMGEGASESMDRFAELLEKLIDGRWQRTIPG